MLMKTQALGFEEPNVRDAGSVTPVEMLFVRSGEGLLYEYPLPLFILLFQDKAVFLSLILFVGTV